MMAVAPQTVTEIQALLSAQDLEPNRKLGQHFLIDGNLMRKVVEAAELEADRDVVLEVGAGTGSLTAMLSERARRVVAVEIDRHLLPILDEVLAARRNVKLLSTDVLAGKHELAPEVLAALEESLAASPTVRFKLVANLPYAVATPLVMNLLTGRPRPELLAFTVQKEVADRLAAASGSGDYGPASLVAQAVAQVELLWDLSPNVFWPKPQVHSTLVRLRPEAARYERVGDLALFRRVAAGLFIHRRKTCLKSLEMAPDLAEYRGRWAALLDEAGIPPGARGDTLTLDEVLALARAAGR
jgi:16S rRNA (adenine1518-N6/adenine1519-N6)-dimethyltransferase